MDNDQVSQAIEQMELGLLQDDPAFVRRVRSLRRAEIGTAVTVFLLLAGATVLLTVGMATTSWLACVAGLVAFLASFGIDAHHKHALQRAPGANH